MYKIPYYTEADHEKVISFIKENSFATVTGTDGEYPVASHLPLEIIVENEQLFFSGHMMKKTNHHLAFLKNENVLVIFNSPHAYIKAGWYGNTAVASTVNYMAVHAKGKLKFTDDAGTYDAIKEITDRHIGLDTPGSFKNIPQDYIDAMLKAIVGFRIEVTSIENVFKLSQNRDEADQKKIIAALEKENTAGANFIAEEMKKRLTS